MVWDFDEMSKFSWDMSLRSYLSHKSHVSCKVPITTLYEWFKEKTPHRHDELLTAWA